MMMSLHCEIPVCDCPYPDRQHCDKWRACVCKQWLSGDDCITVSLSTSLFIF